MNIKQSFDHSLIETQSDLREKYFLETALQIVMNDLLVALDVNKTFRAKFLKILKQ